MKTPTTRTPPRGLTLAAVAAIAIGTGLLLAALAVALWGNQPLGAAQQQAREPSTPTQRSQQSQQATVLGVYDADSVLVLARGNGPLPTDAPVRVWLLGVSAPDPNGCADRMVASSRAQLAELVGVHHRVMLEFDHYHLDTYRRWQAWIFDRDDSLVNADLVRAGLARAYPMPDQRYNADVLAAEASAQGARRGLWPHCGTDQGWPPPVDTAGGHSAGGGGATADAGVRPVEQPTAGRRMRADWSPPRPVVGLLLGGAGLGGYAVSLRLRPYTACHVCKGKGRHHGTVFTYAFGPCKTCDGTGRKLRWGTRTFRRNVKP